MSECSFCHRATVLTVPVAIYTHRLWICERCALDALPKDAAERAVVALDAAEKVAA